MTFACLWMLIKPRRLLRHIQLLQLYGISSCKSGGGNHDVMSPLSVPPCRLRTTYLSNCALLLSLLNAGDCRRRVGFKQRVTLSPNIGSAFNNFLTTCLQRTQRCRYSSLFGTSFRRRLDQAGRMRRLRISLELGLGFSDWRDSASRDVRQLPDSRRRRRSDARHLVIVERRKSYQSLPSATAVKPGTRRDPTGRVDVACRQLGDAMSHCCQPSQFDSETPTSAGETHR